MALDFSFIFTLSLALFPILFCFHFLSTIGDSIEVLLIIFRGPNDILVPPELNKDVQEILEYESIPFEVVVWDLEKAIKYENPIMSRRQRIELEKEQGHPMTWYRYHNFEDIAIYLDYLQLTYPDLVELIHIGRSFEGRPLMVAKVIVNKQSSIFY